MAIISVPKPLREKLGEEGTDALIDLFNKTRGEQKADIIEFVGERFERRLSEEISGLRSEFKEANISLRAELKEDIAGLRTELKKDIAGLRTEMYAIRGDLIKWMFIFWTGQVAMLLGILFAFFR